jgi:hypothetical protein
VVTTTTRLINMRRECGAAHIDHTPLVVDIISVLTSSCEARWTSRHTGVSRPVDPGGSDLRPAARQRSARRA